MRVVSDALAPAPALRPQVTSAAGHAKKMFCVMPNDGDKTRVICLFLPQDKLELNTMVNVDHCKFFAHIFFFIWKLWKADYTSRCKKKD